MTPKQYLSEVKRIDQRIASKRAELDYLRELAGSVSGISYQAEKIQNGSYYRDSKQSRINIRIIDLENQLMCDIERMAVFRSEVNKTIDALADTDEQLVLRYRYLEGLQWHIIAERLGYNVRHVLRIHGNALQHIRYG